MADRFFPNELPDFVPEKAAVDPNPDAARISLEKLLALPFRAFSETLNQAALNLKETIVKETWGASRNRVSDYTMYTGALGTAFLLFKGYQVTNDKNDLNLCYDIVKACDSASRGSG